MTANDTLLYVDPSPRGEWALALAALLPRSLLRSLTLLATAEDVARQPDLLARARGRVGGGDVPVTERTLPGPAEAAVPREVLAHPYDLVIVPPAGRNAIQRMLKGSRIATVVRSVRASVLVARRPPAQLERVLAAVSGGPLTAAVVRAALDVAEPLGAKATFLHVASEVALPYQEHDAGQSPTDEPLEAVRAALRAAGHGGEPLVREGLVVDEVIAEMEEGAHHLLVIGARGGAAPSWASDDLTERILLQCPTSILVVRGG